MVAPVTDAPPDELPDPSPRRRGERVRTALWVAVTIVLTAGVLRAVAAGDERVGNRLDPRTVFTMPRQLAPATTVRITVTQTTEEPGQPASVSRTTTDLDFSAGRGRSASAEPPAEVRFDRSARWLRVVRPSPATQGRTWIRVPVGPAAPAPYDFDRRDDPSGGAEVVLAADEVFELPRERIGRVETRSFRIEFDIDRLGTRVRASRRDVVVSPFTVLDLGQLELRANLDDRNRLVRVRYRAPLKDAPGTTVTWEAAYVYDEPIDTGLPPARASLTVRDPQRATQLAGTTQQAP